jgi:prepilin-type N-terminal cleavage/methylation domain-containing protein
MKKAFTITELLVAVVVLGIAMVAVGGVFKMAIDSQRTAGATSEIMRNLRAITDQINLDFEGFRVSPMASAFFFVSDPNTGDPDDEVRTDRIVFFASGDFQSTRQYPYDSGFKTVVGNVARIWYGQSDVPDPNSPEEEDKREKLLLRRVQIFTVDSHLDDQSAIDPYDSSNTREYDVRSPAEWRVFQILEMPDPDDDWEDFSRWIGRPSVDLADPNFVPMVMAKGVDDFTVQFSNWNDGDGKWEWWPTNEEVKADDDYSGNLKAIRFVFTLYDSKGILEGGRRFSHIVYLEDKL